MSARIAQPRLAVVDLRSRLNIEKQWAIDIQHQRIDFKKILINEPDTPSCYKRLVNIVPRRGQQLPRVERIPDPFALSPSSPFLSFLQLAFYGMSMEAVTSDGVESR